MEGFGKMIAEILGAFLPWLFIGAIGFALYVYEWPKAQAYWTEREQAFAQVPALKATIAQDAKDLQAQKDQCKLGAARTIRNQALINRFTANVPGKSPSGLNASDIEDLLK